jgi:hypothetical protein
MSFIPTLCDGCHRVSLERLDAAAASAAKCSRCGEALRVVPSRSYASQDLRLFEELSATVGGDISAEEAYRLSLELERALSLGNFERLFEPLVVRWPGLVSMLVGANVARQRRSLQMLKTIFDALALTLGSGTMLSEPASPVPSALSRFRQP